MDKWQERSKKMIDAGQKMQNVGNKMQSIGCLLTLLLTIPIILIITMGGLGVFISIMFIIAVLIIRYGVKQENKKQELKDREDNESQ